MIKILFKSKNETLGQYLLRLRLSRKYSQRKLALKTDISFSMISLYERDFNIPSAENCIKLALLYDIDILYFLHIFNYLNKNDYIRSLEKIAIDEVLPEHIKKLVKILDNLSIEQVKQIKDFCECLMR